MGGLLPAAVSAPHARLPHGYQKLLFETRLCTQVQVPYCIAVWIYISLQSNLSAAVIYNFFLL